MFAHIFMPRVYRMGQQRLSLQIKSTGSMESESPLPMAIENPSQFS